MCRASGWKGRVQSVWSNGRVQSVWSNGRVQSVWSEGQGAKHFCRKDREDPIRWREAGTGFYLKIYYIAGRFCNGT